MLIVNEFITEEEKQEFLDWIEATEIPMLQPKNIGLHPVNNTFPNSLQITAEVGPNVYYRVQERIRERYNLALPGIPRYGKVFIHNKGCFSPDHKDHVSTSRVTLVIQKAAEGGDLLHNGTAANVFEKGIVYFDATLPHEVTPVIEGQRIVFIFEFDRK
jgi:hypothetical protein